MIESHENVMQRALDCLNKELGQQFTFAEGLLGKSGAWAVDTPDGVRGIVKAIQRRLALGIIQGGSNGFR